jgi:hypothetical protein
VSFEKDLPPARTLDPMKPPPDSARPTSAMLKGDIDSGHTGDKTGVFDPGLATLGTDDEAAGRPPGTRRVAMARHFENLRRWSQGSRKVGIEHDKLDSPGLFFLGFIAAVAVVFVVGVLSVA